MHAQTSAGVELCSGGGWLSPSIEIALRGVEIMFRRAPRCDRKGHFRLHDKRSKGLSILFCHHEQSILSDFSLLKWNAILVFIVFDMTVHIFFHYFTHSDRL